jgi:hypothetical protein
MTPHFEQTEEDLHVNLATDPYVNRINALLKEDADNLGWEMHRVHQAPRGCVRSGDCRQGCSLDAKHSELVQ